jgi:hypothetical protein
MSGSESSSKANPKLVEETHVRTNCEGKSKTGDKAPVRTSI